MKNIIKAFIAFNLAIILSLQAHTVFSCSCIYGGEFATNAKFYQGVVRAKVIGYGGFFPLLDRIHRKKLYRRKSIIVQVTDVIKGDFEHSELELVGDRGADCREYADSRKYEIGKEFLFVIRSEDRVQELAGCGESSILVNNNIVQGFRRTSEGYEPYSMSLKATIEQMKIEEMKHEKYKQD